MGVYYFFYNISRNNEQNKHVINGMFCDFVTKFDSYIENDQIKIFKKCIELNKWNKNDIILAVPDYYEHDCLKYENNQVKIDNSLKDNYFEKS